MVRKKHKSIGNIKLEVKYKILNMKHFSGELENEKNTSVQLKIQLFSAFSLQPQYNFLQQKSRTEQFVLLQCEKVWGSLKQFILSTESSLIMSKWKSVPANLHCFLLPSLT